MPNARTHDIITIATAAAATPLILSSSWPDMNPTNAAVLIGSYLASGLLFSPDLDLRSTPYRRWGALRWAWLPYRRMVPHRSWVSHSFIIGPLLRILYFAGVMLLLALVALGLLNSLVPVDPSGTMLVVTSAIARWIAGHPATIGYSVSGFVLGGAAHTLADLIVTAVKRRI
ncbi:MAG: metal-binding protein [Chloroflexi bacterium]|nr:metal-binding protein [Chloroflexota bacterium]